MLVAEQFENRTLPNDDLVYVAFRVCYFDLFTALETDAIFGESDDDDDPCGYLTAVPFFRAVPPAVQLDLLASVWAKHHSAASTAATLVDAGVLWSVLYSAGWIAQHDWDGDLSIILKDGPRNVGVTLDDSVEERWRQLFDKFWDDSDFLTIDELSDLPPDQTAAMREMLGVPQEWVEEMFDVLNRARASEAILSNLRGLMTDAEIEGQGALLLPANR